MFKRKKKKNYLKQIYKQNPESNAYIIEVSLDTYNEVFNGWDPSPIKRRDLDPDLLDFIERCSDDIPIKDYIELHFSMPKDLYDESKEQLTKTSILNNFNFIIHFTKKEISGNRKRIFMYVVMSFFFLSMAFLLGPSLTWGVLPILIEGMFIGGWVFLWEAFSLFFFNSQGTVSRMKRFTRLLDTPIHFFYN